MYEITWLFKQSTNQNSVKRNNKKRKYVTKHVLLMF